MEQKLRFGMVFGPVGNAGKKDWVDYKQLLMAVFTLISLINIESTLTDFEKSPLNKITFS